MGAVLPDALRPWQPELADLPPELAVALTGSIRRIATTIGPLRALSRLGDGEPDGFAGLSRRGPFERLLVSEWLLAEEVPDEFLRRAADGELDFLRLRRLEPAGSRRSVVLFDGGPDQLGGPRLAHIAALIVLARRAREGGAELLWGCLQGQATRSGTGAEDLEVLRACRGPIRPLPADLERWEEALGPFTAEDDLWVVGAPGTVRRLEPPGNWIAIDDAVDLERRSLDLELRVGRTRRKLALELPDNRLCARLLRGDLGPHRAVAGTTHRVDPESPMWFSLDANRLLFLTDEGELAAAHVPNSPAMAAKSPPGRTRRLAVPAGARLVAGGWYRRRFVALSARHATILGRTPWGEAEWSRPNAFVPPARPVPCLVMNVLGFGVSLWMIDGARALWGFPEREGARMGVPVGALALHRLGCLYKEGGALHLWDERHRTQALDIDDPVAAVIGDQGWAARSASGQWFLGRVPVEVPPGVSIRGLASNADHETALVGLSEDHLSVVLVGEARREVVPGPGRPMVDLAVSPKRSLVAWRTEDGAISVYSIHHTHVLRRIVPEEEA